MCTNKNYIMQKVCTMSPALQMQQAHINDEFFKKIYFLAPQTYTALFS